jgi:hypothetical protein
MTRGISRVLLLGILIAGFAGRGLAIDHPYTEGTVWNVTFVKTVEGMDEDYLKNLSTNWKRIMDQAKADGLILSYRVFSASAANPEDWNLMLLVETKNMAAFDGMEQKFEEISEKLIGGEEKQKEGAVYRNEIREILGSKVARELVLK